MSIKCKCRKKKLIDKAYREKQSVNHHLLLNISIDDINPWNKKDIYEIEIKYDNRDIYSVLENGICSMVKTQNNRKSNCKNNLKSPTKLLNENRN